MYQSVVKLVPALLLLSCYFFHAVDVTRCRPQTTHKQVYAAKVFNHNTKVVQEKFTCLCMPDTTGIQWTISTYQQALWVLLRCGTKHTRRWMYAKHNIQRLCSVLLAPDEKFTDCSTWCSDDCLNHFNLLSLLVFSLQMHLKLLNIQQFCCIQWHPSTWNQHEVVDVDRQTQMLGSVFVHSFVCLSVSFIDSFVCRLAAR